MGVILVDCVVWSAVGPVSKGGWMWLFCGTLLHRRTHFSLFSLVSLSGIRRDHQTTVIVSYVSPSDDCHCVICVTIRRLSLCHMCHHLTTVIVSYVSPSDDCHCVVCVTIRRLSLCQMCHHQTTVIVSYVSPSDDCHCVVCVTI